MPDFDVYIEKQGQMFGTTSALLVPFIQNPVTATDGTAAISSAASVLAQAMSEKTAEASYVVFPAGTSLRGTIDHFDYAPVFL